MVALANAMKRRNCRWGGRIDVPSREVKSGRGRVADAELIAKRWTR